MLRRWFLMCQLELKHHPQAFSWADMKQKRKININMYTLYSHIPVRHVETHSQPRVEKNWGVCVSNPLKHSDQVDESSMTGGDNSWIRKGGAGADRLRLTCTWAWSAPPQSHFSETDPGRPYSPPVPETGLTVNTWRTKTNTEEGDNCRGCCVINRPSWGSVKSWRLVSLSDHWKEKVTVDPNEIYATSFCSVYLWLSACLLPLQWPCSHLQPQTQNEESSYSHIFTSCIYPPWNSPQCPTTSQEKQRHSEPEKQTGSGLSVFQLVWLIIASQCTLQESSA